MLRPSIEESLQVKDGGDCFQYLYSVSAVCVANLITNVTPTRGIMMKKSSDPNDLVRKALE